MKKPLIAFVVLLFVHLLTYAGGITSIEAERTARQFLLEHQLLSRGTDDKKGLDLRLECVTKDCFIFNEVQNVGWVAVSGQNMVVAYSTDDTIDIKGLSAEKQDILNEYFQRVAKIENWEPITDRQEIKPMLQTEWGQDAPYNLMTPIIKSSKNDSVGYHALTGCVATAIAQIMKYYQWPKKVKDIPFIRDVLPSTAIDWDVIKDQYEPSDSSKAAWEVSKLMYYVGASICTGYNTYGSGAWMPTAVVGMERYLDYSPNSLCYYAISINQPEEKAWKILDDMAYHEIVNNRPFIFLLAIDNLGAHAIDVDGYSQDGYYHFNWGWNGKCNGYYLLPKQVIPYNGNDVACEGLFNGLMGILPNTGETDNGRRNLYLYDLEISEGKTYERVSENDDFRISLSKRFEYIYPDTVNLQVGFAIYKDGELIDLPKTYYTERVCYEERSLRFYYYIGAGLKDGVYELRSVSRKEGTEEWIFDTLEEDFRLIAVIEDNRLKLYYEIDYSSGIKNVNYPFENTQFLNGFFDFQGRRLNVAPLKGIYIKDGRKFVSK